MLGSLARRRRRPRGKSGKYLVSAGLSVLVVGLFTETLDVRLGGGPLELSVLEIGILILGVALVRLFVAAVFKKLKRGVLKRVVGVLGLSAVLPAIPAAAPVVSAVGAVLPSLAAVPLAGRVTRRLSYVAADVLGLGETRAQRLKRAVGGTRGVGASGVGVVLVGYGAEMGRLGEMYTVFGHQLSLLNVFVLLSVPGAAIYAVRNW